VAAFREVPEVMGDFARLYIENGKSYEKRHRDSNISGPWPIRCNAEIRRKPKGQDWSARTGSVPPKPKMSFFGGMTPSRKISKLCFKRIHTSPIHVLCSDFMEIVRREVSDTLFW